MLVPTFQILILSDHCDSICHRMDIININLSWMDFTNMFETDMMQVIFLGMCFGSFFTFREFGCNLHEYSKI